MFSRAGRHGEGHRLDVGPSAGSSAPSPERRSVRMTSSPSERSTSAQRAAATRCGRSGSPTPPGGATRARAVSASGGTGSGGFDARVRCRREDDPAPRLAPALRPTAVVPEPAGGDALPSASSRAAEDAEDPGRYCWTARSRAARRADRSGGGSCGRRSGPRRNASRPRRTRSGTRDRTRRGACASRPRRCRRRAHGRQHASCRTAPLPPRLRP